MFRVILASKRDDIFSSVLGRINIARFPTKTKTSCQNIFLSKLCNIHDIKYLILKTQKVKMSEDGNSWSKTNIQ